MTDFTMKTIKDYGQIRETDGIIANVEFSSFYTDIPDDKQELFSNIYTSMEKVKKLIDAANLVGEISKDFKPNDPKIKKIFELIEDNNDLITDILSFMYNRIAIESNNVAARTMEKVTVDNGKDFESILDDAAKDENAADLADSDDYGKDELISSENNNTIKA